MLALRSFVSAGVLLPSLSSLVGAASSPCQADNCARAITGTFAGQQTMRMADCSTNLRCTVTPTAETTYVTSTVTTSPAVNVSPSIATPVTSCPSATSTYASACSGFARYSSACGCFSVTRLTTTATAPATVTLTTTIYNAPATCPAQLADYNLVSPQGSCGCRYDNTCGKLGCASPLSTVAVVGTGKDGFPACGKSCDSTLKCTAFQFDFQTNTCSICQDQESVTNDPAGSVAYGRRNPDQCQYQACAAVKCRNTDNRGQLRFADTLCGCQFRTQCGEFTCSNPLGTVSAGDATGCRQACDNNADCQSYTSNSITGACALCADFQPNIPFTSYPDFGIFTSGYREASGGSCNNKACDRRCNSNYAGPSIRASTGCGCSYFRDCRNYQCSGGYDPPQSSSTEAACRSLCDNDIGCTGYQFAFKSSTTSSCALCRSYLDSQSGNYDFGYVGGIRSTCNGPLAEPNFDGCTLNTRPA